MSLVSPLPLPPTPLRCLCESGQIGDGRRCYGNLMERIIELDRSGNQRENLTGAVALFGKITTDLKQCLLSYTALYCMRVCITGLTDFPHRHVVIYSLDYDFENTEEKLYIH